MYNLFFVAEYMSNLPPTICLFKSNAPVIHVDFSAESCPYHTRQSRISYRTFHEVHEHKGNIVINFIFCISLIQIATEALLRLTLGCSTLCWESIRVWTGGPDPPISKKKRVKCNESLMKYCQLSSGVYRTPFSAPKISV